MIKEKVSDKLILEIFFNFILQNMKFSQLRTSIYIVYKESLKMSISFQSKASYLDDK